MITFERFEELAKSHNVVPLEYATMADLHTPVSAYLTLREQGTVSFLLETVEPNEKTGRFSFIGINPVATVRARGELVSVQKGVSSVDSKTNIFETLERLSGEYRQADPEVKDGFLGGFVGYLGYDNVRHLEKISAEAPDQGGIDDAIFGLFGTIVRFDHRTRLMTVIHNAIIDGTEPLRAQYDRGRKVIETLELRLRRTPVATNNFHCNVDDVRESVTRDSFCGAVRRAKEHIYEGDIFQVVLSRRVQLPFSGDLFPVYRALRTINPSPYLFFIDFGETTLIGSSPEMLVKVQDRTVEVFPIAGTRRRGVTDDEDNALEHELAADAKEIAEHVMLVDLGRNDVGRISEFGTVSVPVFKRVER
ncbi:MAG TPA: chorismate-binding protein, partial [Bacteroidota bacterium]|nr:chorismate-binding protein [Bacteroidota bacterium]